MKLIFAAVLTVVITVVAYLVCDHVIAFQEQNSLFLFDSGYWNSMIAKPLGLGLYITAFIVQFFYYPLLGAFIIGTLYGGSYYLLTTSYKGLPSSVLALIPILYLFLGYIQIPFIAVSVFIFLNIAAFKIWTLIPRRIDIITLPLLIAGLYFMTGIVCYLFVLMTISRLVLENPKKLKIWITVLISLGVMYAVQLLATIIYTIPFEVASSRSISFIAGFTKLGLVSQILWVFFAVAATLFSAKLFEKRRFIYPIVCSLMLCGFGYSFSDGYNPGLKEAMKIEQAAVGERWDEVLTITQKSRNNNKINTYLRNTALFRTGNFIEQLLDYPQSFGENGLFFAWGSTNTLIMKTGDLAFANIGMVNEAHRWAFESMVVGGENAVNYKKLVGYNTMMKRPAVGERFERILEKSMFHSDDKSIEYVPQFISICADSIFVDNDDFGENLRNVIAADSTNTSAFDYLTAYYLLGNNMSGLIEMIPSAIERYNGKLPRIIEEALLVYGDSVPVEKFAELGYEPSQAVKNHYVQFRNSYSQKPSNPKASLQNAYGKTYWYYLAFISPYGLNIK